VAATKVAQCITSVERCGIGLPLPAGTGAGPLQACYSQHPSDQSTQALEEEEEGVKAELPLLTKYTLHGFPRHISIRQCTALYYTTTQYTTYIVALCSCTAAQNSTPHSRKRLPEQRKDTTLYPYQTAAHHITQYSVCWRASVIAGKEKRSSVVTPGIQSQLTGFDRN
jgi:hypothetical protein